MEGISALRKREWRETFSASRQHLGTQRQCSQHPELMRRPQGDGPADCAREGREGFSKRVHRAAGRGGEELRAATDHGLWGAHFPCSCVLQEGAGLGASAQGLPAALARRTPPPSQGSCGKASHGGRGLGLAPLNPAPYPAAESPRNPGDALSSRGSQALVCNVATMTQQGFSLLTHTVNRAQQAVGHAKPCGGMRGHRELLELTGPSVCSVLQGQAHQQETNRAGGQGASGKASWRRCHSTSDLRREQDVAG